MRVDMIKVGDIDVRYEITGEGPPLVMIMGFTANIHAWPPELIEELGTTFRLFLFDNRGAGKSTAGQARFSMKQFAKDTAGLMDALGIERTHILGVSMGGMIAQQFALDFPEKVDRLVLLCTAPGGPHAKPPSPLVFRKLIDFRGTPEERARRSMDILFPEDFIRENPERIETMVENMTMEPILPRNARRQMGAIVGFNAYDRLPSIRKETLVMCGEKDVLIPPKNSRLIAERVPRARMVSYPNSGHGFIDQHSLKVAREIEEFYSAP